MLGVVNNLSNCNAFHIIEFVSFTFLTLLLLNTTCPVLANSVDPGELVSKPTDLDLHCH